METIVVALAALSVLAFVFALGLQTTVADATTAFRQPLRLGKALLAMNVLMPVLAVIAVRGLALREPVKLALVLLAVSPVPPLLPRRQMQFGHDRAFICGMLLAVSLLSIVLVPLSVALLGKVFAMPVSISVWQVARIVLATILAPLTAGMLVCSRWPSAEKTSHGLMRAATLLLLVPAAALLVLEAPTAWHLLGNGTVAIMAAFAVVALAIGHGLGGPPREGRPVVALATALRHPGVVLAIVSVNFPAERKIVLAAVLMYLLVASLMLVAYRWLLKKAAGWRL